MSRMLLVSNGHGEDAIALRIARELRARGMETDLFPLVGEGPRDAGDAAPVVGPRAVMPSGGIIAFGNLTNIVNDLRAGLVRLLRDQWRFLRAARRRYAAVIAVGDTYCFAMARRTELPAFFVGTAKSVLVAPYGPGEVRVLRPAVLAFARDEATAASLRARGVRALAPGNVMMDMLEGGALPDLVPPWLALLPGSRECAYDDARFLARVVRCAGGMRGIPGVLSIAPQLDRNRMAAMLRADGWCIGAREGFAFEAMADAGDAAQARARIYGWRGRIGSVLHGAAVALGQAGTGNEQAAWAGVPVVAFEPGGAHRTGWYRMRQQRLLGEALLVVDKDERLACREVVRLLDDVPLRARMSAKGRERMGPPGGAAAIAGAVAAHLAHTA